MSSNINPSALVEKLPVSKQISYAIGQLGWSLLINIIGTWLVYFYLPPKEANLPILITDVAILVIFNVIGLVSAVGRLWDAFTDPLIASASDRAKFKWGRRIPFLAAGGFPAALFCILVFVPPSTGISSLNLIWMIGALMFFYLFLTMYVTPFFALIPELGHTANERLNLSTYISVTYFLGIAIAAQAPLIWDALLKEESLGLTKVEAIQYTLGGMCLFASVCMYFPVMAINEKRYCKPVPSDVPMMQALRMTFKNRSFLFFALSDFAYFLSLTILQTGLVYYVTVLLGKEEGMTGQLFVMMGVFSFILYPLVNLLAKKFGKKPLVIVAFLVFFLIFACVFFLGSEEIPAVLQAYLIVIPAGIPLAILGILPNAILADIAELDAIKTGSRREGLFYAGRSFMQKLGQTFGILIFSSLLLLGRDASNPTGVQLTGPAAALFCLLAILLFSRYNEKQTLKEIATHHQMD